MKTHLTAWTLLLLFSAALPMSADDAKEQAPDEDTILGTWYAQFAEGEVLPKGMTMKLVFEKDGKANATMSMDEEEDDQEQWQYTHDKESAKLTLYELDDAGNPEAEPEVVLTYSFVDDMLVFRYKEGPNDEEESMELTRKPEGTKRHQKLRAEQGDEAGDPIRGAREVAKAMQSSTQLRGIHQGATMYATKNKEIYAPSIGDIVVGDMITPEYALSPWSTTAFPKDFDEWAENKRRQWVNENTSYVYLLTGKKMEFDIDLVAAFELPQKADQEKIRLIFEDNHATAKPYAEADKLIKKQTGYTIEQWMKTTSPGTGKMVLPKKQEAGEEKAE